MTTFSSPTGRVYPFGRINVATPGTPQLLNQNVPFVTAMGSSASSAPTMRCSQIIFAAPGGGSGSSGQNAANAGAIYICYKGGNRAIQNSIIKDIQPGGLFVLGSGTENSNYDPSIFVVDADNSGDGVRVTGIQAT